jgi:hypothetical protein
MRLQRAARWCAAIAVGGACVLIAVIVTLVIPYRTMEGACESDPDFTVTSIEGSLVPPSLTCHGVSGADRSTVSEQKDRTVVLALVGILVADVAVVGTGFWASRWLLGPGTR